MLRYPCACQSRAQPGGLNLMTSPLRCLQMSVNTRLWYGKCSSRTRRASHFVDRSQGMERSMYWDWTDGSAVKSTGYSYRELSLVLNTHVASQNSL